MSLILAVDDVDLVLDSLRDLLEVEGHEALGARNGQEALECLDAELKTNNRLPDLILCDLEMPVMDGLELCKALRTHPSYKTIPFVLITGNQLRQSVYEQAICDEIILKPFTRETLFRLLDQWAK